MQRHVVSVFIAIADLIVFQVHRITELCQADLRHVWHGCEGHKIPPFQAFEGQAPAITSPRVAALPFGFERFGQSGEKTLHGKLQLMRSELPGMEEYTATRRNLTRLSKSLRIL